MRGSRSVTGCAEASRLKPHTAITTMTTARLNV
jgi:hypothetical protein